MYADSKIKSVVKDMFTGSVVQSATVTTLDGFTVIDMQITGATIFVNLEYFLKHW